MIDLSSYKVRILSPEDVPLFEEAVKSAACGATRAAYILIWISCAESLKRRFREAQRRDGEAARIVGEFEKKETEHKSIDKYMLDKAKEYGFLPDLAHLLLLHVYEMRCLYGHPYEQAPSEEQVTHAASAVVNCVLSQPVKLRHGFGNQMLHSLINDPNYLDNLEAAVEQFAKDVIPRIDSSIYGWLIEKYWLSLEPMADDSTMKTFFLRGIWFTRTYLREIGVDLFNSDQWHDKIGAFPKTLNPVFAKSDLFTKIGQRAQDYIVGYYLDESERQSFFLGALERLMHAGVLANRQKERFFEKINSVKFSQLSSSGISTVVIFDRLMAEIGSHNWYLQNPAIDFVINSGYEQIAALSQENQCLLGRNVLQAAEGNASSASTLFGILGTSAEKWPFDFVRGIVQESFTNEANRIRFKKRYLDGVLRTLDHLAPVSRTMIVNEVIASINAGQPRDWVTKEDFMSVGVVIKNYKWAEGLANCLENKMASLPEEEIPF